MANPINIKFKVDASGGVGATGIMSVGFGASISAYGGSQLAAKIRPFQLQGDGVIGNVGILRVSLTNRFFIAATGSETSNGRAALTVPKFRSLFGVYRDTMPLFVLRGISGEEVAAAYLAYAVNVSNAALTEYSSYPFNHMVRFKGKTLAFSDTGMVELGGDLDDAAQIDAVAELSPSDFETSLLKRMPYAYVGAQSNEKIRVTMVADELEIIASLTATNGRNRRARLARGPKAVFWAGKIENIDGEDFSVDRFEYLPMQLRRKV